MEAFQARAQQADKLGGTAAGWRGKEVEPHLDLRRRLQPGVCLPASHSGAITLTCAGLADLDDDEESKISTCSIGVDNLKNRAWSAVRPVTQYGFRPARSTSPAICVTERMQEIAQRRSVSLSITVRLGKGFRQNTT